jgi:hypothetical protein
LAILAGAAVSYRFGLPFALESRKYTVGVATARILVDTPDSQVVDVAPKGSDSTGARANLISTLMVDGEIKTLIAKRAGLDPKQLIGLSQAAADPTAVASTPTRTSFVLSTQVTTISNGTWLPIIEIDTQAPDAAAAQRLANAAVSGLREYLDSKAAADAVPDADRLQVSGLGVAQARNETRGPRLMFSLAATIFIFLAGCVAILAIESLVRGLRAPQGPRRPVLDEGLFDAEDEAAWNLAEAEAAWAADGPAPVRPSPRRVHVPAADAPEQAPSRPEPSPPRPSGATSWWGDPS